MSGSCVIPVAQYVRMSDESQQYSIENQKAAIQEYAALHGFVIVKTYDDPGRSGVVAAHRKGLSELLRDVVGGKPPYEAILVYDVSRWGRFQDTDEAAHYEFLCKSGGVPIHYCAEPFANDGTPTSTLFKALKRSMAAEFSRELSVKEFRGKSRLAQLGFWVGGNPAFGYRRLLVSADGTPKQVLKWGEQKNLKTDRVTLVPGPQEEIECIRAIFSMALEGESCRTIARHLNQRGITHFARQWLHGGVYKILTNPMYAGVNVWNRTSTRMRSKMKALPSQEWITKRGAFSPIIDQRTFDVVQVLIKMHPRVLPNRVILKKIRRLLKINGHLSRTILENARGLPSLSSIRRLFGSYRRVYQEVGYQLSPLQETRSDRLIRSIRLRSELIEKIRTLFPENIVVSRLPDRRRSVLLIDGQFIVSVLFCSPIRRRGKFVWWVEPNPAESGYVTLLCPVKRSHERLLAYFVYPSLDGFRTHYMTRNDPFIDAAVRLRDLSQFYTVVKKVWNQSQSDESETT